MHEGPCAFFFLYGRRHTLGAGVLAQRLIMVERAEITRGLKVLIGTKKKGGGTTNAANPPPLPCTYRNRVTNAHI